MKPSTRVYNEVSGLSGKTRARPIDVTLATAAVDRVLLAANSVDLFDCKTMLTFDLLVRSRCGRLHQYVARCEHLAVRRALL